MKKIIRKLALCYLILVSTSASAEGDSFARIEFGREISLEVPKNWTYLDEALRQQINTSTDASVRLLSVTPNPGKNVILIAGNGYTNKDTPSATLRLSVRHGEAPSQSDLKNLTNLSAAELKEILQPHVIETERLLMASEMVQSAKVKSVGLLANGSLICIHQETEVVRKDKDVVLQQSYLCPVTTKSIKLNTSYRKNEVSLYKPITQYVWQSLRLSN